MQGKNLLSNVCLALLLLVPAVRVDGAVKFKNFDSFSTYFGTEQVLDLALDSTGQKWGVALDKSVLKMEAQDITEANLEGKGALLIYLGYGDVWTTTNLDKNTSPRLVSRAVAIGPGMTVWCALGRTIRKLVRYDKHYYNLDQYDFSSKSGMVTIIPSDGSATYDASTSGLDFGVCNDVAADKAGNVWLAFTGGIFLLDGKTKLGTALSVDGVSPWKQAVRVGDGYTSCIALDRLGAAYFGTRSSGVLKYDGQRWSQAANPGAAVTAIAVDRQNRLWFATAPSNGTIGIHTLESGVLKTQTFAVNGGRSRDGWYEVTAMDCDSQGKLWVGTLGGGVKVYDGAAWTGYSTADGLSSSNINSVLVESPEKIWFGTDAGISLLQLTSAPDPTTTDDRYILKSCQITDSTEVMFYGRLDGTFNAATGTNLAKRWSFSTGGAIHSSPAVERDGTLYFGSNDRKIYALYPNGTLKWSYQTGDAVVSSPALAQDGTVYAGSKDGYLYALNSSGGLKWRYKTEGAVYASPALAVDGTVYVGSFDGKMYALSPAGALRWSFTTGNRIYSSAAVGYNGEIYFGSNDFSVYALNPDGSLKWSYKTGGEVIASPAIDLDGTVYVPSSDWEVYAFNPDGSLKWSYLLNTPVWSSPTINLDGIIEAGTCGAVKRYYSSSVYSEGSLPPSFYASTDLMVPVSFNLTRQGESDGGNAGSGSEDSQGSYTQGYTGTYVTSILGKSLMVLDDNNGGFGSLSSNTTKRGYQGRTSWPRFRHDCRNTGNVMTSLEIPVISAGTTPVVSACDFDHDGNVSVLDLISMLRSINYGQYSLSMDLNQDGKLTILDVLRFLTDMQTGKCGSATSLAADIPERSFEGTQGLPAAIRQDLIQALNGVDLSAENREAIELLLNGITAGAALPKAFSLAQNAPNPFNPSTTITFEVPEGAGQTVELSVFDVRGQRVRQLVNGTAEPGKHFAFFDGRDDFGRDLPSGVYFYRLRAESFSQTRKMILLK